MTTTPEAHFAGRDHEPTLEAVTRAPALITEQEVAHQRSRSRAREADHHAVVYRGDICCAGRHSAGVCDSGVGCPPSASPLPKRHTFLERACLAREMDRL